MKKLKWILFIAVSAIIVSCSDNTEEPDVPIVVPAQRTIIAYMDGNNNLASNLYSDIQEMERGSANLSPTVNLVVFANIRGKKPYIAEMANGKSVKVREWESTFLATNPDSMLSVMKWIIDKYPAYEYATIFGGHGTGSLVMTDAHNDTIPTTLRPAYAYGWDYNNTPTQKPVLWISSQTLAAVISHLPHMKFFFFDCCLMQDIEVANNIQRYTDYIIAPVSETPAAGAPYENIVPLLSITDAEVLCDTIIKTYYNIVKTTSPEKRGICISALRTSRITNLLNVTQEALREIKDNPNYDSSKLFDDCIYYYCESLSSWSFSDPLLYDVQSIFYEQSQNAEKNHCLSEETYNRFLYAIDQCVLKKDFDTEWTQNSGINFNDFTVTDENFGGLSISRETIDNIIK